MKLAILHRPVVATLLVASLALSAGCPARAVTKPPVTTPVTQSSDLTADGKHVAITRLYKGECVGGRGGCYSVTLEPDGTYRHMLLDAAVTGTYEIASGQVTLTPNGDALPQTMTLSADLTRLDDMVYEPAIEP